MSILGALSTGASALLTNQKVMEVIGNNISNANTEGYSRQSAVIEAIPTITFKVVTIGLGSRIGSITREHDELLTKQIQSKNSSLGESEAKVTPLAEIEEAISISESGLAGKINDFFDAWQSLSNSPAGSAERDVVLRAGERLADGFIDTVHQVSEIQTNINTSIIAKVETINAKLQELVSINDQVAEIEVRGFEACSFRDRRDNLLADLSKMVGIEYMEGADGRVNVQLEGGLPLIQSGKLVALETELDGSGLKISLNNGNSTTELTTDNFGGELKGLMHIRDEFIPEIISDLDTLAYSIATNVNDQHKLGMGLDGVTDRGFFEDIAAESGAAVKMAVALTDLNEIAAGKAAAPGDNTNALDMFLLNDTPIIDGQETFARYYAKIATQVGIEINQNDLIHYGEQDSLVQLENLRDSKSGVSLEEEMVRLIQYQRSFEASAKFVSTIDEMMETLMSVKR